jgi:hypothetical protein
MAPGFGGPPAGLSPEQPAAPSAPSMAETMKGSALRLKIEVGITPILLDYFRCADYKHTRMYVKDFLCKIRFL